MKPGDARLAASAGLTRRQVWGMPVVLTITSSAGLVVGLLADGAADVVACVGLAVPIAIAAWHAIRSATKRASS